VHKFQVTVRCAKVERGSTIRWSGMVGLCVVLEQENGNLRVTVVGCHLQCPSRGTESACARGRESINISKNRSD
jgi:hypothetical protein